MNAMPRAADSQAVLAVVTWMKAYQLLPCAVTIGCPAGRCPAPRDAPPAPQARCRCRPHLGDHLDVILQVQHRDQRVPQNPHVLREKDPDHHPSKRANYRLSQSQNASPPSTIKRVRRMKPWGPVRPAPRLPRKLLIMSAFQQTIRPPPAVPAARSVLRVSSNSLAVSAFRRCW